MDVDVSLIVTKAMKEAGCRIASNLIDAQCSWSMNGLGGSKSWREWLAANSNIPNRDLVLAYVDGKIESVEAIYIAMDRAK